MVAAVAAEDPETAAKIAQPKILTCSSRPGSLVSHGDSPVNMSSASFERNRISPIQINSGRAARAQLLLAPQLVVASTLPSGALENNKMPAIPTANSENATQSPPASRLSRKTSSRTVMPSSLMARPPCGLSHNRGCCL